MTDADREFVLDAIRRCVDLVWSQRESQLGQKVEYTVMDVDPAVLLKEDWPKVERIIQATCECGECIGTEAVHIAMIVISEVEKRILRKETGLTDEDETLLDRSVQLVADEVFRRLSKMTAGDEDSFCVATFLGKDVFAKLVAIARRIDPERSDQDFLNFFAAEVDAEVQKKRRSAEQN